MPSNSRDLAMRWYHYMAYFFGGAFLANTVPHFVNGISGNAFQSPFASPPGQACPPQRSMSCGACSTLPVAYLLICRVGSFNLRKTTHVLTLGAGVLLNSLMLAHGIRTLSWRTVSRPLKPATYRRYGVPATMQCASQLGITAMVKFSVDSQSIPFGVDRPRRLTVEQSAGAGRRPRSSEC